MSDFDLGHPTDCESFLSFLDSLVAQFYFIPVICRLKAGNFSISDYHKVLCTLCHQVFSGPGSLALAAGRLSFDHSMIRAYLMRHADEEKGHWQWIFSDLKSTGYVGRNPLEIDIPWAVDSYIAYNFYVAEFWPIGRLAIATMLETVSGRLATELARDIASCLSLEQNQIRFLSGHGVIDARHSQEIRRLLSSINLDSAGWRRMSHHAMVASRLYRGILEEC